MNRPTDFDAIEVPDSARPGTDRGIIITPTGDRAIRLKSFNRSEHVNGVANEIAIDLTPTAIVRALSQIPGFTVTYERPRHPLPTKIGAVVRWPLGIAVLTDFDDEPWRLVPAQTVGNYEKNWANVEQLRSIIGDDSFEILSEGVEL